MPLRFGLPFELVQDSSGGEQWRHRTHANRHGEVPCTFRGYRLRAGDETRPGLRATPAVSASHGSGVVRVAVEHFWQNFPKAIEAGSRNLTLRFWPRQYADLHEIQGGEQKTHSFTLALGDDSMSRDAMFWGRSPSIAAATPEWYAAAEAIAYLTPACRDTDARYRQLVDAAIEGDEAFERKRESIDEYGWRHFGDIYADHENPFSGQAEPIVSHYNNQYDAVNGFARAVHAHRRSPLVAADDGAGDARHRHRHLPHRSRQGGVQQRPLLAHVPLRRGGDVEPPLVPAAAKASAAAGRRTSTTTPPACGCTG